MKYATWAVAIILCFFFGRIMYSPLSGALLAKGTGSSAVKDLQEVKFGTGSRELRITIDLRTIDDREMPKTVELKKGTVVSASGGSQETPLEKGSSVTVSRMNGYNLEISAGGPLTGLVPIANTDFAERVIAYRARRHFGTGGPSAENSAPSPTPPATLPEIARNDTPAPVPSPPPASGPAPAPEPAPAPGPAPAPEPEPEPAAGTDPEKMEPEAAPAPASLDAEQIVSAMKESVKAGSIKEFKFEQVEGWKAGEEETVDGESYQTGLAAYKAQTIFGEKTVQAKALIKGGKVIKWIYAKTGMEIR